VVEPSTLQVALGQILAALCHLKAAALLLGTPVQFKSGRGMPLVAAAVTLQSA
jgi:hypothetical protein